MAADPLSAALVLPPLFSGREAPTPMHVLSEAVALAGDTGAGTFIHAVDDETLAFAVVLEPDQPLVTARFAFFAAMSALAEAIAAHCPPERGVAFDWPDGILYDAARLGGGRLVSPRDCGEHEVPDWLVFGCQLIWNRPGLRPGDYPASISLFEEEFETPEPLMESFARHLMRAFDAWEHEGIATVSKAYLERLKTARSEDWVIDANGDLLSRTAPAIEPERHSLIDGLGAALWMDAETGRPRL